MRPLDYVGEIKWHDFDRLVQEATGQVYESVAHNEWANDCLYVVYAADPTDKWNAQQLASFIETGVQRLWANVAMGYLVTKGLVPGKIGDRYLVHVSW